MVPTCFYLDEQVEKQRDGGHEGWMGAALTPKAKSLIELPVCL